MTPGSDWLEQARRLLETLGGAAGDAPAAGGAGSADGHAGDCRWCPVCQFAAVLRGERPEVTAALADVLTATATALRSFAEASGGPAGAPAGDEEPAADPAPAVQRIDIA